MSLSSSIMSLQLSTRSDTTFLQISVMMCLDFKMDLDWLYFHSSSWWFPPAFFCRWSCGHTTRQADIWLRVNSIWGCWWPPKRRYAMLKTLLAALMSAFWHQATTWCRVSRSTMLPKRLRDFFAQLCTSGQRYTIPTPEMHPHTYCVFLCNRQYIFLFLQIFVLDFPLRRFDDEDISLEYQQHLKNEYHRVAARLGVRYLSTEINFPHSEG